ncbi:MAG: aconitase X catalytic domain-containing protein, partial [Candidatus Bilamarchaeaceae archaeon]
LEFLQHVANRGAKVAVPTFLNPAGMDIAQWQEMNVPKDFAEKQFEILKAYSTMGIAMTCTCTPYLIGIRPRQGEHIAWAESSAIAFANSVLGARTNREGGPSALAAAITGVTPYYGLHVNENRVANLIVEVETQLRESDFGAMGYYVGKLCGARYPAFVGIRANEDELKLLGAAMAASGSVPIFFVKGLTPEFRVVDGAEEISFTEKELKETKEMLDAEEKPELVTLGCPHASLREIENVVSIINKKGKPTVKFWICVSRAVKEIAVKKGYDKVIRKNNGLLVADTCMVVCPLEEMGYKITGTNSGKAAKYLPSLCRQKVAFGDIEDILYR